MSSDSVTMTIIIIFVIILIFFLLLVFEFEYNINVAGKIVPANEWILTKRPDGSLISTHKNNEKNLVKNISTFQVERGDVFQFKIFPSIIDKTFLEEGDTIGTIQSSETYLELADLEKQLNVVRGSLKINLTSSKESVLNQAMKEIELAKERFNLQNKILKKQNELFINNMISEEEIDNENSLQKIYEIQAKIAEANLKILQSGSKPEYIDMIKSEIISIEKEIKLIKNKIQKFTLTTPIDGRLHQVFAEDTIVYIGSSEYIAIIPINVLSISDIKVGQKIDIVFDAANKKITGTLLTINKVVRFLNNEQIFIATANLNNISHDIPINLIVECNIITENKTGFRHMVNFINSILN